MTRRVKTALDRDRRGTKALDRSCTSRSSSEQVVLSPQKRAEMLKRLNAVLEEEERLSERDLNKSERGPTEADIGFHNFIHSFYREGYGLNAQFKGLLGSSRGNRTDLELEKRKIEESERSVYRFEMGLEEAFQDEIARHQREGEEKQQKELEEKRKQDEFMRYLHGMHF